MLKRPIIFKMDFELNSNTILLFSDKTETIRALDRVTASTHTMHKFYTVRAPQTEVSAFSSLWLLFCRALYVRHEVNTLRQCTPSNRNSPCFSIRVGPCVSPYLQRSFNLFRKRPASTEFAFQWREFPGRTKNVNDVHLAADLINSRQDDLSKYLRGNFPSFSLFRFLLFTATLPTGAHCTLHPVKRLIIVIIFILHSIIVPFHSFWHRRGRRCHRCRYSSLPLLLLSEWSEKKNAFILRFQALLSGVSARIDMVPVFGTTLFPLWK